MVGYRQRRRSNAWIVGILIFILAMVITFADVYGLSHFDFNLPGDSPGSNQLNSGVSLDERQIHPNTAQGDYCDPTLPTSGDIPSVPEPATLTLIALGCGILLASRKKMTL
jgi:hypothetical protein